MNEMNANIRITSGPAIEKPGDLAALLTNLAPGDVLFIDEIHRLNKSVEEILKLEDTPIAALAFGYPKEESKNAYPCLHNHRKK